ncbi:MAG TPA: MlaD family protein [Candidatus Acidoferrales bacterium]|nr:MlaD family protein [Candidatus Acidoferrales bacterium]
MSLRSLFTTTAAFVAGGILVLAGPAIWRLTARVIAHRDAHYRVVFNGSVSGLAVGDAVERNGVVVGEVTDIGLTNDAAPRALVSIELQRGVPVMRDSSVSFGGSLITGVRSIEIDGGTPAAGRVPKGDLIVADEGSGDQNAEVASAALSRPNEPATGAEKPGGMSKRAALTRSVQDFSAAGRTLKSLSREISSPERWRSIDSTLANLNRSSESLSHTLERVSTMMDSVAANRDRYYVQLDATIERLNRTLDQANDLFATSNRLMKSTDAMVSSTASAIDSGSAQMQQTLSQIDRTARRIHETVQTLEPNPSSAIWGGWSGPAEPQ